MNSVEQLEKLKHDLYEEMDRLRRSRLDNFESFSSNVAFHLGYLDSTVGQLIDAVLSIAQDQQGSPTSDQAQE